MSSAKPIDLDSQGDVEGENDVANSEGDQEGDSRKARDNKNKKNKLKGKRYKARGFLAVSGKLFKRQRNLTSPIWENFEFLESDEDDNIWCKCIKCGQVYSAESHYGTGNLIRHAQGCKRRTTRDVGQLLLSGTSGLLKPVKFCAETFRELMAVAIVKHQLPFQFVEYEGIRRTYTYLCPDIKLISRNTARADIVKIYRREQLKLKETLQSVPGRISFTSDCWSSLTSDGYITLTAHFVDHGWNLKKKILNFCIMPPPHSGVHIAEKIFNLIKEWGIQDKAMTMTLDNASANDVFVELLKCLFGFV